jgi:SOS-response transcriptional repressor LexA
MPFIPPTTEPGSPAFRAALADVGVFADAAFNAQPLTPKQLDCLRVVAEWIDTRGVAPTLTQLATELDMASKGAVAALLTRVEAKGWIRRNPGRARAIQLLRRPAMPDFTEPEFTLSPALTAGQTDEPC